VSQPGFRGATVRMMATVCRHAQSTGKSHFKYGHGRAADLRGCIVGKEYVERVVVKRQKTLLLVNIKCDI
jgi:hypothetical protein